jgi:glycine oxidase
MIASKIGIVGGGVLGRVLALMLQRAGWQTTLFDEGSQEGVNSASYAAARLLSPYVELDFSEPIISQLGVRALDLWPTLLPPHVFFRSQGTLVVAHPNDEPDLIRLAKKAKGNGSAAAPFRSLDRNELETLEPEIDPRFPHGLYFPAEGQLDNRESLIALAAAFKAEGGQLRFDQEVLRLAPGVIQTQKEDHYFSWIVDTRGLKARKDLADLRGVRGELVHLFAPDVNLHRPVRVLHPRFPLYVAPRPGRRFIVGATSLESESESPIRVRSLMELLSAAFSVHSGFGEAQVLETVARCRPAFPSHLPVIRYQEGLIRINGLYRHGFLISPSLAQLVVEWLGKHTTQEFSELFQEAA